MANFGPGEADDLAKLPRLDAKIILQELKHRYSKDKIYTYVGDILIAVNPFKTLNIYDKNASRKYKDVVKSEEPPHIYAVADAAYQAMLGKGGNKPYHQCCVISGESGAGKTESAKFFINQVIELSHGESQLEQQILQVNPLLEAFGNAQTVMNDNSSRFGKYIQLKFIKGGVIGAKISEYLLEKSRVALQNAGEENFHIFYYLFSGLSQEEQQTYCLGKPKSYSYLSNGYNTGDAKKNKELFSDLMNAIDLVGFLEEEQTNMFVVLSSVLNMGNIVIDEGEEDDAVVKDQHAVTVTAKLLGMDVEKLKNILTTTSSTTNKGSIIKRRLKEHQASDVRDATAKALYGRLFSWIVNRINRLLAPPASARGHAVMEIGILDIFGFEHFEVNSFEQSCINLANEQLQFFFNQHIFMWEQEEYKREGIDWTTITFEDNKPVLDLFLEKPIGLLALLDEESHFPQSTDQTFVQKLVKNCGKSKHLFTSPHSQNTKFTIGHYAGKVEYDSAGFLEKNRDTLPQSVTEALEKSTNELISSLFSATVTRTGTLALGKGGDKNRKSRVSKPARGLKQPSSNKATVSNQFRTSLTILMEKLTAAHPHFIRCIKPNHMKVSGNFNSEYVEDQLNYTGVLETTRIRREGYPVRPTFEEFVNSYKLIVYDPFLKPSESSSRRILKKSKLGDWHIGKTKVFLKYWHAEELAKKLEEVYRSVIKMQKVVRGFLIRRRKKRLIQASKQHGLKVKECLQLICLSDSNINKGIKALKEKKRIELIPQGNNTLKYASLDFGKMNQAAGKSTSTASGTQTFSRLEDVKFVDEGVGDFELGEDEFVREPDAIKAKFGAVTTKETAVQWFQETQAPKGAGMEAHGVFHEWFHGVISRRRSEMLLTNKPVGCFLVRVSESRFGYTLSFRVTTRCKHYMIDQTRSGKYIIVGLPKVFKTLSDLVEYHKENPINEEGDVLIEPCGQENEDDADYVDLLTGIASPRRGRPKATMAHVPPPLPERRYKSTMR